MPALPTAKRQRGQSHFRCAPEGAVPFSLARNLGQSPGAKIGTVPASLARCYGDGGAVEGLLACVEALTRGGSLWAVSPFAGRMSFVCAFRSRKGKLPFFAAFAGAKGDYWRTTLKRLG